ncbi:hypothetical protein EOM81_08340 [bacterium]|nr:hypothetical protein [bacterium]
MELSKVTLIGLGINVKFNPANLYTHVEADGTEYKAATTTDGRIIVFDEAHNGWLQIARA